MTLSGSRAAYLCEAQVRGVNLCRSGIAVDFGGIERVPEVGVRKRNACTCGPRVRVSLAHCAVFLLRALHDGRHPSGIMPSDPRHDQIGVLAAAIPDT